MTKIVQKSQEEQDNKSKGMGKDMINLLNQKASLADIDELRRTKTNKIDTESLLESISIVHKQFKQALVLLTDSIRSEVENPVESALSKENK